ncbi:UbiA family prenyltransferase [Hellea balneolensis]|uniref:UbiA family prenyltransferase n=1 Tax=Hellea balneolensis TaxID=287478 RepID=UPI00138AD6BE|nr:UbiA family prenyltransferase [Hellea balneolensis]
MVLDVDGTLIRNDLTHELFLKTACEHPLKIFKCISLGLTSKAKMKSYMIGLVGKDIQAKNLPYIKTVTDLAEKVHSEGRNVILCSGSHTDFITQIEAEFSWISNSHSTTDDYNMTSENKLRFLQERYPDGFDYVGNSSQDLVVWPGCYKGYAIAPPKVTSDITCQNGDGVEILEERHTPIEAIYRAMRLHQWAKNLLIFLVPILAISKATSADILNLCLGFLAMGFLASSTYIFNDLLDIHSDRNHSSKKSRPLASGLLSIPDALLSMTALLIGAIGLTLLLPSAFTLVLFVYFVITLVYSIILKRVPILDVMVLAFLFLIRVVAGAAIIGAALSPWLVSFIVTFFLSLALVKRYTELVKMTGGGQISGRGYVMADKPVILGFGMTATAMTMLSFVIYGVIAEQPVLSSPISVLIVGSLALYWLMRVWLLAHRGELNDDPVLFAAKDKTSLALGGVIFLTVLAQQLL